LEGTGVTSYSMHPGFVYTGIAAGMGHWASMGFALICCWGQCPCIRNLSQGASTIVYLCLARAADLKNGAYYVDCHPELIERRGDDPILADKWYEKGLELFTELSQKRDEGKVDSSNNQEAKKDN